MGAAQLTSSSRREFIVRVSTLIGAFAGTLTPVADAKALPHLTRQDPQALALHYTEDASKINAREDPTHTAGAICASCKLYQGGSGEPFGPCQLYPGKAVSANGWCMGYQQRT